MKLSRQATVFGYYDTTPDYNLRASITYPPIWSEAEVLEV